MNEAKIGEILTAIKSESFVQGHNATNEEAMGLLLSKFFNYDGQKILQATYWALEDSNFHKENITIGELLDNL